MGRVIASITTSVDGFITGPDDGPRYGLGRGGERLHYWVMGGPWTYDGGHEFAMHGPDKEFYDELVAGTGAGIVGRGMNDAAGAWAGPTPSRGRSSCSRTAWRTNLHRSPGSRSLRGWTRHWSGRPLRPEARTSLLAAALT
ncbi:hypothetical protein [Arthrobacter sp. SD76]|uniref:hypothetical protein n=1 Tax=Arthrobacter sp. SD76 TaxID=3415007 RepID=UPI003C70E2E9